MLELLVGVGAVAAGVYAMAAAVDGWRRRQLRRQAAELELAIEGVTCRIANRSIWVDIDERTLEVRPSLGGWELVLDGGGRIPRGVVLGSGVDVTGLTAQPTGDPSFDRVMQVHGDPARATALLGGRQREALRQQLERRAVHLIGGRLTIRLARREQLGDAARELIELADILDLDLARLDERLADGAESDPIGRVRTRCLQTLIEHFPQSTVTSDVCRRMLQSMPPELALPAARIIGVDALPTLRRLVLSDARDVAVRLAALDVTLSFGAAADDLLCELLASASSDPARDERLVDLAIVAAAHRGLDPGRVADALGHAGLDAIIACARALPETHHAVIEKALVDWIERVRDDTGGLQKAIRELGGLGGRGSVEVLHELSRRRFSKTIAAAASNALDRIRARLGDVEAGRLSISDDAIGGELSLDDKAGGLSRPEQGE